jgi:Ca2+:H+ antiporter
VIPSSGGSSESETSEPIVTPIRCPSPAAVTTETPDGKFRIVRRSSSPLDIRANASVPAVTRRDLVELVVDATLVAAAAVLHFADVEPVVTFIVAAIAIAALARLVGIATEQLGSRLGSSSAGAVQSALGNLPELFIALFALHNGLIEVVQGALVGSVLANSLLVLGIAFTVGGLRNGIQRFDKSRTRMIATLTALAASTLALPTLAHAFHAPSEGHERALSLICAGVLLAVFLFTLPGLLASVGVEQHATPRWSLRLTSVTLAASGIAAALVSDWFVTALQPAIQTLHMSPDFAGLVVVAIAGNAVENVVGVQLASRNQPDFAISVILNSSLQVALALTPVLVFASLAFATELTLVFPTMFAFALILAAMVGSLVVYDGESTWPEGVVLIGFYVVIAADFWWGA